MLTFDSNKVRLKSFITNSLSHSSKFESTMSLIKIIKVLSTDYYQSPKQVSELTNLNPKSILNFISVLKDAGAPLLEDDQGNVKLKHKLYAIEESEIRKELEKHNQHLATRFHYIEQVDSTNQFLLDFTDRMSMHKAICVADLMSAGRGRRMRPWFGGAFENIMMSIAWKFPKKRQLPGLSLAIAVIVARSLKSELGIEVQMKWPNDILWNNQKLGGILVEIVESVAVVGIGLNGRISDQVKEEIGQPVISIYDIIGSTVNRAKLIEALALSLNSGLQQFQEHGFQPFRQYWLDRHALSDCLVQTDDRDPVVGHIFGLSVDGALKLRQLDGTIKCVYAGELSLRKKH